MFPVRLSQSVPANYSQGQVSELPFADFASATKNLGGSDRCRICKLTDKTESMPCRIRVRGYQVPGCQGGRAFSKFFPTSATLTLAQHMQAILHPEEPQESDQARPANPANPATQRTSEPARQQAFARFGFLFCLLYPGHSRSLLIAQSSAALSVCLSAPCPVRSPDPGAFAPLPLFWNSLCHRFVLPVVVIVSRSCAVSWVPFVPILSCFLASGPLIISNCANGPS